MRWVKAAESISVTAPVREDQRHLQIYLIFTDIEATKGALTTAIDLTRGLSARLVLLVAKIVPWPLPLEAPPVSSEFTEHVLSDLAREYDAEIAVKIFLCREREPAIRQALEPGSVVVIGGRKRWWPWWTPSLARLLKRDGHDVIVAGGSVQPLRLASTMKSTLRTS